MNILVDMNLSPRWVPLLQRQGFEASHWSTVGKPDAEDPELMQYAQQCEAVILTRDLDFGTLLALHGGASPSVVLLRVGDLSPEAIGDRLVAALRQCALQLAAGALLLMDERKNKLRLLPLQRRVS